MVNNFKTPTGKARKGQVTVRPDSGSIKTCFPRNYFSDGKQVKLSTGINPDDWEMTASRLQKRLQLELEENKLTTEDGVFNLGRYQEILQEYGLRATLRVIKNVSTNDDQLPPKPELSLMEIWEMYCEYIKPEMRESYFKSKIRRLYPNLLNSAIEGTQSEDALKIRNWLIENRSLVHIKALLSHLSKAHIVLIRQGLIKHNPYDGLTDGIKTNGAKGKKQDEIKNDNDDDVLNKSKAYTWEEAQIILDACKDKPHWHNFLKFKFLTGCRTGEAIALMWQDVLWDEKRILIRRTYDETTKKFYPVKTAKGDRELIRVFPMPKDEELWNLLKSIPQGEGNEIVFKPKFKNIISASALRQVWGGNTTARVKGFIPELIKQGKLSKYLPCYNTRHTYITHAIYELEIPEKIVAAWCGHSETVSTKHYQDIADRASQINPNKPYNQSVETKSKLESLEDKLAEQQRIIDEFKRQINDKNENS